MLMKHKVLSFLGEMDSVLSCSWTHSTKTQRQTYTHTHRHSAVQAKAQTCTGVLAEDALSCTTDAYKTAGWCRPPSPCGLRRTGKKVKDGAEDSFGQTEAACKSLGGTMLTGRNNEQESEVEWMNVVQCSFISKASVTIKIIFKLLTKIPGPDPPQAAVLIKKTPFIRKKSWLFITPLKYFAPLPLDLSDVNKQVTEF